MRALSNPGSSPWPLAVIIIVLVVLLPHPMLHQSLEDLIVLSPLLAGASLPAVKYSNR